MIPFKIQDVGCFADGAFGHAHIRKVLADLVEPFNAGLAGEVASDMSDDASEEDDAIDLLNEQACEGVYFMFYDGDLMLVAIDDDAVQS